MNEPMAVWCQTFATVFLVIGYLEYKIVWVIGGVCMLMLAALLTGGKE